MQKELNYSEECADLLDDLFITRNDTYTLQRLSGTKKAFSRIPEKISKDVLIKHVLGRHSIGGYQLDIDSNVKYGAYDFDENTLEDFEKAKKLYQFLKEKGYFPLFEYSGGGKYKCHIFVFTDSLIPAKQMKSFLEEMSKESGIKAHESFPKQDFLTENGFGNFVKLPLGYHYVTQKYSTIADEDFNPITDKNKIIEKLKCHKENKSKIPKYSVTDENIVDNKNIQNETPEIFGPYPNGRFFSYCLNNDLPAGITKSTKIGKYRAGVNNNILKNMAIALYNIGYSLNDLEEEILKKNWKDKPTRWGNLKGWFNKAKNESITEVAIGELVLWCSTYAPELMHLLDIGSDFSKSNARQYLTEKELTYDTSHMPHFDSMNDVLALMGKQYGQSKKAVYHTLVSLSAPSHLMICEYGRVKTDLRFHTAFCMPSGKGKKNIKECVKSIYKKYNIFANIKEPRKIHPEQLIGKVIKRKQKDENGRPKDVYIKNKGFLGVDLLFLEEAHEIYNSNDKSDIDCRDSLTVATDMYGENLIQKNLVDNLDIEEERLEYYPHGNIMSFFQPLPIREDFATKGLIRRTNICYAEFPRKTNLELFKDRLRLKNNSENSIKIFADYMKKINEVSGEWSFEDDFFDEFFILHNTLLQQGFLQGGKQYNFTQIWEYPMQDTLLKFSCLNALSNLRTNITRGDVQRGFVDLMEKFANELIFVKKKVRGTLDYGNSWRGETGKSQQCLQWLSENEAFSKEGSGVSIGDFQQKIASIYDCSIRRGQDKYKKMKENKLIYDWRGQGSDNKVWLSFKPEIDKPNEKVDKKFCPRTKYFSLIKNGDKK